MKSLAIIGSRGFADYEKLCDILLIHFSKYNYTGEKFEYIFDEIISGACKNSPDELAARFAKQNNIKLTEFPADWSTGKGAGFARNYKIIESADFILAFWRTNPDSTGTKHSLSIAKKLKKPTLIIYV